MNSAWTDLQTQLLSNFLYLEASDGSHSDSWGRQTKRQINYPVSLCFFVRPENAAEKSKHEERSLRALWASAGTWACLWFFWSRGWDRYPLGEWGNLNHSHLAWALILVIWLSYLWSVWAAAIEKIQINVGLGTDPQWEGEQAKGQHEWFSHFAYKDSLDSCGPKAVLWRLWSLTLEWAVVHHTPQPLIISLWALLMVVP